MILRRLSALALALAAGAPLVSASRPLALARSTAVDAPVWTTATMELEGRTGEDGTVRWRVADVTYLTTGSSHGRKPAPPSLAVTVQNAISWGTVFPGAVDRIQTNNVPAGDVLGIFKLTGSSIRTNPSVKNQFRCYFGFPTTVAKGAPAATMPVVFTEPGYTYGGTSPNPTPPGTAVDLTQYSSSANQYVDRLTGTGYTFYFFIGGKAVPSTLQAAGSYTTSIAITCSLTGS